MLMLSLPTIMYKIIETNRFCRQFCFLRQQAITKLLFTLEAESSCMQGVEKSILHGFHEVVLTWENYLTTTTTLMGCPSFDLLQILELVIFHCYLLATEREWTVKKEKPSLRMKLSYPVSEEFQFHAVLSFPPIS